MVRRKAVYSRRQSDKEATASKIKLSNRRPRNIAHITNVREHKYTHTHTQKVKMRLPFGIYFILGLILSGKLAANMLTIQHAPCTVLITHTKKKQFFLCPLRGCFIYSGMSQLNDVLCVGRSSLLRFSFVHSRTDRKFRRFINIQHEKNRFRFVSIRW